MSEGHNSRPDQWHDDERCEALMKSILQLKDDPFVMEAAHIGYTKFFGNSYTNSDFADVVRREIYSKTGREIS